MKREREAGFAETRGVVVRNNRAAPVLSTGQSVLLWAALAIPSCEPISWGWPGTLGYLVISALGVWVGLRWLVPITWKLIPNERVGSAFLVITLVLVFVAIALVYPHAASRLPHHGSDNAEALILGARSLFHGQYPYYQLTYLGNLLTPTPGAFILAAPFVVLHAVQYQSILWLAVACAAAVKAWGSSKRVLVALWLTLAVSPALWRLLVTGTDFATTGIMLAVLTLVTAKLASGARLTWATAGASILLGLAATSRLHLLIILLPLAVYLRDACGMRRALAVCGTTLMTAALVTLPWWAYDPSHFTPAHSFPPTSLPDAKTVLIMVTLLSAVVGATLLARRGLAGLSLACAVPLVTSALLTFVFGQATSAAFCYWGSFFVLFAAWYPPGTGNGALVR